MRSLTVFFVGFTLALALVARVAADPVAGPVSTASPAIGALPPEPFVDSPIWSLAPPTAALPANFADADYRPFVPLVCHVRGDTLEQCHPVNALPPSPFLHAAVAAAAEARIAARDAGAQLTDGRDVFLFINFPSHPGIAPDAPSVTQPLGSPPLPPGSLTNMRWLRVPTVQEFDHYAPRLDGAMLPVVGHATLDCLIDQAGLLVCTVTSEDPLGANFGEAGIRISRGFRAADRTKDGRPTSGGRIRVNLTFNPAE